MERQNQERLENTTGKVWKGKEMENKETDRKKGTFRFSQAKY